MRALLLVGLLKLIGVAVAPLQADEGSEALPLPLALRDRDASGSGTSLSAVRADANWTAAHQCEDGHWSAADFDLWCHGLPITRERRMPDRGEGVGRTRSCSASSVSRVRRASSRSS